jgi:hypothetical protein
MSNDNIVGELSFYYNKLPYTSRIELPDAIVLYEINDIFASGTTDIIGKVNIQTTIYKHDTTNIGKIEEIYVFSTGLFEVVFLIDDISQDGKFKQNDDRKFKQNDDDREKRKYNKVKISNLPYDITTEELTCLLENWGHVNRVYVKNFKENSFAIIEFKFKDELDYFIKALNSTPFENQIISVTELDNF